MRHIDHLIQRYIDNTATDEERAQLMELIRSGNFEADIKDLIAGNLKTEMLIAERPGMEASARAEEIFRRIVAGGNPSVKNDLWIEQNGGLPRPARKGYTRIMRYAASLLLLAVAGVLVWSQYFKQAEDIAFVNTPADTFVKVRNDGTAIKKITLRDGSVVSLEPGTEVRYAGTFGDKREVYLSGDAFFEVTKDAARPFLVYTREVTTRVLGTSFRVKANRDEKEIVVAVKTGKVSVSAGMDKEHETIREVTVTPNQQAVYKRNENVVVKKVVENPEVIVARPSVKNYYVNAQVVFILRALGESYGVEIKYDEEALAACTLTSDIIEEEGLYEQLEIICNALGGRYRMEDDASIVIEAGGCP